MIDRRNGSPHRALVFPGTGKRGVGVLALVLAMLLASPGGACGQDREREQETGEPVDVATALKAGDYDAVIERTRNLAENDRLQRLRAVAFQRRGEQRFFEADIDGAIRDFDAFLAIYPEQEPHHWQRGLAYYYAEEYKKGKEQFESHQGVNSQDVENAVWHFLCSVRAPGGSVEKARANLIPIERDLRVPMAEVHDLFAGEGSPEAVLGAASPDDDGELSAAERNHLCYAHLYLGLYYEALGETDSMEKHIRKAAVDYAMDHYMGRTAQVHAKLRGVE